MKTEKTNYETLRHQLKLVAKEFNACKEFLDDIDEINSPKDFKRFISRNIENICDRLHIDFPDSDEIDELNDNIYDLERDIENLQEELDDLKCKYGLNTPTLEDEFKSRYFLEYKDRFTAWQIQGLFQYAIKNNTIINDC